MTHVSVFQDVEIKEEGTRHMLILFNCRKDMAGSVDFSAANAKSSAQLRVKGDTILCGASDQSVSAPKGALPRLAG